MHVQKVVKVALDGLGAVCAVVAAVFWLKSASRRVPRPIAYYGPTPETDPFLKAFRASGSDNRIAALFSGAAAFLSGIATLVGDV